MSAEPSPESLAAALAELTEAVRQQGRLLARIAEKVGLTEAELGTLTAGVGAPSDAMWQRLGLVDGERRTVTVLFADVSGFTALSEHLDAEEFELVMKDAMSAIAAIITRNDGSIEKFIGDAVCAIFGAPIAHEDEPERAARSALEINRVLSEKATARPDLPAIGIHAGINTGIVIAGTVGDGSQFGVMGDTINTASRLMNLAQRGEIFVSAETARRLRREFRLEDRGVHEVKGKERPVAAFNVLGELEPDERGEHGRVRAPFVDRETELAQLEQLASETLAGDGTSVVVVGEPGVGKTRLVAELVEAHHDDFSVIRGSARVVGEQPLGLLIEAFAPHLPEFSDGAARNVVSEVLRGGVALPPDFELTFARLLHDAAARAPMLIVLDDLELADRGSLELLRYLSRSTRDAAMLWIFLARQAPARFDAATDGDDDLITLRLAPLDDDDVAQLFDGLLPDVLSRDQRARLAYQADGNPEFAEEIALSLIDLGVVTQSSDGTYRLTGDPDAIEIPSSVSELVEARMDRVATNARITLQDAAVIGMRFRAPLLTRVASVPDALQASLAELVGAELIVPPGPDEEFWTFRSHVVRQVAYESILRRRRPRMHRAVAEALLALEPGRADDNVELIASHYELSDDPALAIPYLRLAVDYAEASHSVAGTVDRARRALGIRARQPQGVDDTDAAWFLEHLGVARLMLGDRDGLDDLRAAVDLRRMHGDVAEEAALEERVGWYVTMAGDPTGAGHHLVRAQELAESGRLGEAAASSLRAGVAVSRAFSAGVAGKLTVAFDAVDGAAAEARTVGDTFTEARALMVNGVLWLWEGKPADARGSLRRALELAWTNRYSFLADRCGRWLVASDVEAGRYDDALELAAPLLARADERGDPSVAVGIRAALAELWRERGDIEQARALAGAAVELAQERSVAVDAAAEAYLTLARSAIDSGQSPDEPLERLAALLAGDPWLGWRLEARLDLARARAALAAGAHEQAASLAVAGRLRLDRAAAQRERLAADAIEGEARAAAGDHAGLALAEQALAAAETYGSPYLVAEAARALARTKEALSGTVGDR
ncbi:MAG TPA: adenylate/guanylate cyclase domain-containing protein [Acidimicrobiales bacterium]|nr:adenylate/guanylate cyclase domain-containing protein [Acidimicrobiales bacterium]